MVVRVNDDMFSKDEVEDIFKALGLGVKVFLACVGVAA